MNINIKNAKTNKTNLYSEIVIKNGKISINDAKTAPAPSKTNKLGNAQQIKVEELLNNDK